MTTSQTVRRFCAITSVLWFALLSGCILPKVYVDPQYRTATYQDIASSTAQPVKLTVTGLTNRKLNKAASKRWTQEVTAVLEKSRVFTVSQAADAATLEIEINNIADTDEAMKKGFVTGLTFGISGSVVTDRYIMTATYRDASGASFSGEYKHAIHTVVGAHDAPIEGVAPTPLSDAPGTLAEDLVLNFIKDFQIRTAVASSAMR